MGIIILFTIVLTSIAPIALGLFAGIATGAFVENVSGSMKARKNHVQIQH